MLTKKQILKVSRLADQTGGFEGFNELNFSRRKNKAPKSSEKGKNTIKLKLIYVTLPCGDVVIRKSDKKGVEK